MFGKAMRIPDELIIKYFEFTTTLTGKEIDAIKHTLESGGNPKDAKERLAHQIVGQYHGQSAADAALDEWTKVHSQRQIPDEMPSHVVAEPTMLFRVIVESKLASGTTEAKRLVQEGAVRLDGEQVKDPNLQLEIDGGARVLQVGRRKFVRLVNPRHA
jgi:tyrosyl-tRNA synthetase